MQEIKVFLTSEFKLMVRDNLDLSDPTTVEYIKDSIFNAIFRSAIIHNTDIQNKNEIPLDNGDYPMKGSNLPQEVVAKIKYSQIFNIEASEKAAQCIKCIITPIK